MSDFSARLRPLYARFVPTVVRCLLLTGCGIAANHKPIPPGTRIAFIHFGPVRDGFVLQSVQVHDAEMCHPDEFARFNTIGAYLGETAIATSVRWERFEYDAAGRSIFTYCTLDGTDRDYMINARM